MQPPSLPFARLPSRRELGEFSLGFVAIMLALGLPSPGVGPFYARAHTAIGNAIVQDRQLASGVQLYFSAAPEQLREQPWTSTLHVVPPGQATRAHVPIDLRALGFLPTATFISCALAAPLGAWRRNARVLALGLAILLPLLVGLMALPLAAFLGGAGPIQAFSLSRPALLVLQLLHRALVAPPGMTYALPFLLWLILLRATRPKSSNRPNASEAAPLVAS